MSKYNNKTVPQKIALVGIDTLFIIFIILFLDIELLQNGIMNVGSMSRTMNLIPLTTIKTYFLDFGKIDAIKHLLTTAALFSTIGIFASVFSGKKFLQPVLMVLICALSVEIFQYLAACGVADIDDFLINVLGGFIGIVLDKILLRPIDKAIGARFVTFILLLFLGSLTVYSNYQLSDFKVEATVESYNDYLIQEVSEGNNIIKGKIENLTNESILLKSSDGTEAYNISDQTKMIIQRVKKEYTSKGILKNTVIVYEEVDRREFLLELENQGNDTTIYVNNTRSVVAMEIVID